MADLVTASEGSFGPTACAVHALRRGVPGGLDLRDGHFLHRHVTLDVVFGVNVASVVDQVLALGTERFPEHGPSCVSRSTGSEGQEQHKGLSTPASCVSWPDLLVRDNSLWYMHGPAGHAEPDPDGAIAATAENFVMK